MQERGGNQHQIVLCEHPVASIHYIFNDIVSDNFSNKKSIAHSKPNGVHILAKGALQHAFSHNDVSRLQYRDGLACNGRLQPQVVEMFWTYQFSIDFYEMLYTLTIC